MNKLLKIGIPVGLVAGFLSTYYFTRQEPVEDNGSSFIGSTASSEDYRKQPTYSPPLTEGTPEGLHMLIDRDGANVIPDAIHFTDEHLKELEPLVSSYHRAQTIKEKYRIQKEIDTIARPFELTGTLPFANGRLEAAVTADVKKAVEDYNRGREATPLAAGNFKIDLGRYTIVVSEIEVYGYDYDLHAGETSNVGFRIIDTQTGQSSPMLWQEKDVEPKFEKFADITLGDILTIAFPDGKNSPSP